MLAVRTDQGREFYLGASRPARWEGEDIGERILLGNISATVYRRTDGFLAARWTPVNSEWPVEARLYTPEQRASALNALESQL